MEEVLKLTSLVDLVNRYNTELASGLSQSPGVHDDHNELLIWLNNIGGEKSMTQMESSCSSNAYRKIKRFLLGQSADPYETLMDKDRLCALGLDHEFFCPLLAMFKPGNGSSHVRDVAYAALFLNTMGLSTEAAIGVAIYFFDENHDLIDRDNTNIPTGAEKVTYNMHLSIDDIENMCSKNRKDHSIHREVRDVVTENRAVLMNRLRNVMSSATLNGETILNEVIVQIHEPMRLKDRFLGLVGNSIELLDIDVIRIERLMRGKRINILGARAPIIIDELLRLILPKRYRLVNGMNIAFLDILIDVLLGKDTRFKQIIYDLVTFSCARGIEDTDTLFVLFSQIEHKIDSMKEESETEKVIIREWSRQQHFILWFETARLCIQELSDITIGCPDDVLTDSLQERRIYYFRGNYYVKKGPGIFFSKDFKKLICSHQMVGAIY